MSADPTTDAPSLPPGLPAELGSCRLIGVLGRGGMGSVYLAEMVEDRSFARRGERVALKVLHPAAMGRSGFKRFLREAEVGRRVSHPAVVRTHDADAVTEGSTTHFFLVMEYVEGQTLRGLLSELGSIPEALLRHLGAQIAQGLGAIHEAGAVHRDLKPGNVIVTREHQVKVMDLGIARGGDEATRLTQENFMVGTPLYSSPEQCAGIEVGPASDLYSLGVLLHECATGENPFQADHAVASMRRHLELVPPRIGESHPEASPFLEELVAVLLEKEPAKRFASARELAQVLEQGEASAWWKERERELLRRQGGRRAREGRAPAARFVGRARELDALLALGRAARRGQGALVLIDGEPGIGKTRLLEELERRLSAELDGCQVLHGRNLEGSAWGGFGAFVEALRNSFGGAEGEARLGGYLAGSEHLASGLGAVMRGAPARPGEDALSPESLHHAFELLARRLAAERPVAWLVEDLHLASNQGLLLLRSLARVAQELPLLLVATTRPGLSAELLSELERQPRAQRMTLSRLEPGDVMDLVESSPGGEALAARLGAKIADKSDGNPLFILELLRSLAERSGPGASPGELTLPSSLRDLMTSRLQLLSEEERALLDVAAAQGLQFDPALVAEVRELKRLRVLEMLAAVERRTQVIRATGSGFRFDHPLLRDIVYEAIPAVLRVEYHALLAGSFEERLGGAEAAAEGALFLAEHYLRGGLAAKARNFVLAGLEGLAWTHRQEALLDLARLALATPGLEASLAVDILLREAEALDLLGRRGEQKSVLESALAAADRSGDLPRQARARSALGWMLALVGDYAAARPLLEEAAGRARTAGDDPLLTRALGHLGNVAKSTGDPQGALAHFEESLAIARRAGLERREGDALGNLGNLLLDRGEYGAARDHYHAQLEIARRSGDGRSEARALGNLAVALQYLNEPEQAREALERQIELSLKRGYRRSLAIATGNLGLVHFRLGDLGAARRSFERHLELSAATGDRLGEVTALVNLGGVLREEGAFEEAAERLEAARAGAVALGARRLRAEALRGMSELARARGRPGEAVELGQKAIELLRALGAQDGVALGLVTLGRVLLDTGDAGAARTAFHEADALVGRLNLPEPGPLPAAYLALLGERPPHSVVISEATPVSVAAEAHIVLHQAGGAARHLLLAGELVDRLCAHLTGGARQRFREGHTVARRLPAQLA